MPIILSAQEEEPKKDTLLNIIDLDINIVEQNKSSKSDMLIPNKSTAIKRTQSLNETYTALMADYKDLYRYLRRKSDAKIMLTSINSFKPSLQYKLQTMDNRATTFDEEVMNEIDLLINTSKISYSEKKEIIEDLAQMRTDVTKMNTRLAEYSQERLVNFIKKSWQ